MAAATEGFAGADLQALCSSAVHAAVRRAAPSLMNDLDERIAATPSAASPHVPVAIPPVSVAESASIGGVAEGPASPGSAHGHPSLPPGTPAASNALRCISKGDGLHPPGAGDVLCERGLLRPAAEPLGCAVEVGTARGGPCDAFIPAEAAVGVAPAGGAPGRVQLECSAPVAPPPHVEQILDGVKASDPSVPSVAG